MSVALETPSAFHLVDPGLLWLALLVPLGLLVRYRGGAPAVRFAASTFRRQGLPGTWRVRLLPLPLSFQVLGLLLAALALARPVWRAPLPLEAEGIDILLCLDVSSSMDAKDMDAERSRLDVAKDAAADFIAGRPHDRIGLIRFARYPDVVCPLTLNHDTLSEFLAPVTLVERFGPEDRTGIGTAVARSAQMLRGSAARSKVVILLTDGEENVATKETPDEIGPLQAARVCAELGVRVYTIAAGIGRQDRSGQWQALDTTQVESVARVTRGGFYAARDAGAMSGVYASIDELEKVQFEEQRYTSVEGFLPFLSAALALLLASRLLQSTLLEVLP